LPGTPQTSAVLRSNLQGATDVVGGYRWRICGLLFFVTTLNYVDRQVLGVLAPELQRVIGWNEIQYGNIVTVFQAAYAAGLVLSGRFIDRVGVRAGYAVAIAVWSFATIGHSLARTVLAFAAARLVLGLGEAANFPAAIKTVAEWFPRKERALATGIFNSGANIGAIVGPAATPWIAVHWGWPWVFVCLGTVSALWIVPWLAAYRRPDAHPKVGQAELAHIQSDPPESLTAVSWASLLPHRQTWSFLIAKFLTDPIWWFFLFWLPKFLHTQYGLSLTDLGWPLIIIYTISMGGSIAGGWLPARLLKRGWSVNAARKTAMLVCALCVVPIIFGATAGKLWLAVALIGLATAAHQGWSANLFTTASDMFPKRAVASVVGIGGCGGAIGGMFIATFTGLILQFTHSYVPVFAIAGCAYLAALGMMQLLTPNLEPAKLKEG
jgi:ACS family hexuronate transporter-like MFS transporter